MAVVANMRKYVEQPPVRGRYGLFSVAHGPLDLPMNAIIGGLEYETSRCGLPTGLDLNCDTPPVKIFADGHDLIIGNPFLVRSSMTCGPVGLTDATMRSMVLERLKTGEQGAVERIFSEETFGQNAGLPGATVVSPSCTTDDVPAVIGALEAALYAQYGAAGILHVPYIAAAYLMRDYQIYRDNDVWYTPAGTAISIGNYANESPAGVAADAGEAWIYITGQVTVWRTPDDDIYIPTVAEALNRTTNQVLAQAEREYVVTFECEHFAANTILCAPGV